MRLPQCFSALLRFSYGTALALGLGSPSAWANLPASWMDDLRQQGLSSEGVAVWVKPVDAKQAVLAHQAQIKMNPASTMKLVTTLAALEQLGPDYQWSTRLLSSGTVVNGHLQGPLIVQGGGDPWLTTEAVQAMLQKLQTLGIKHLDQGMVLDRSRFRGSVESAGYGMQVPGKTWLADPAALNINHLASEYRVQADASNQRLQVQVWPPLANNPVLQVRAQTGDCGGKPELELQATTSAYALQGAYPYACGERSYYWVDDTWLGYHQRLLRSVWTQLGGALQGDITEGRSPEAATVLVEQRSLPLPRILAEMNKNSSNPIARTLFLNLGAPDSTEPSLEAARQAVQQWWTAQGWAADELNIDNGSGLSRQERISAQAMGQLLDRAAHSPLAPLFWQSLPLLGVDGTLHRHHRSGPLRGRAWLKTGTLNDVKALAGQLIPSQGPALLLVFLVNRDDAERYAPVFDAWLARLNTASVASAQAEPSLCLGPMARDHTPRPSKKRGRMHHRRGA